MKIIQAGNIQPWWIGKQGKCWKCKAIVQLDEGDTPELYIAQDQRDNDAAKVKCPTKGCTETIIVTPGSWIGW